jgi:hypothetical protein
MRRRSATQHFESEAAHRRETYNKVLGSLQHLVRPYRVHVEIGRVKRIRGETPPLSAELCVGGQCRRERLAEAFTRAASLTDDPASVG